MPYGGRRQAFFMFRRHEQRNLRKLHRLNHTLTGRALRAGGSTALVALMAGCVCPASFGAWAPRPRDRHAARRVQRCRSAGAQACLCCVHDVRRALSVVFEDIAAAVGAPAKACLVTACCWRRSGYAVRLGPACWQLTVPGIGITSRTVGETWCRTTSWPWAATCCWCCCKATGLKLWRRSRHELFRDGRAAVFASFPVGINFHRDKPELCPHHHGRELEADEEL